MTKFNKKPNLLIIAVIFVSYFIIPSIGIQLHYSNTYAQVQQEQYKLDSLPSTLISHSGMNNINLESYSEHKISKFDDELNEFLIDLTISQKERPEPIKIIINFKDSVSKEERIEILDSIFDDYELVSNYDIISGVYLKINPNHLIANEDLINDVDFINKIYKSKVYSNPYIVEEDFQLNALNPNDYSNWWLSAVGAENLPYNGSGIKVAVIDTGIYNHSDLNVINNSNFVTDESPLDFQDDVGHGTHVGGIIAGDGGGSSGKYRGIAPGALLINARAGNASGLSDVDIINAIQWSSKPTSEGGAGADIISMSFGGGYPIISDSITQAISNAKNDYGVIFVSSAGNSGPEYFTGSTPAAGIDVIAVGATDRNDELASFSSWGPTFSNLGYPDVSAPGVSIISTESPDSIISEEQRYKGDYFDYSGDADYIPLSGTSMSCPIVAGALAILLEAYPTITPETARIALLEGARKLNNENDDDVLKSGAGIVNVSASLEYLDSLNPDYNDIAKLYPDNLPVKPFDLLKFPGDHQKFNLTLISGKNNTYDIEIPNNIQGISISNTSTIVFSESGIAFIELEIQINNNAFPGIRNFQINLTVGGEFYDTVNFSLEIRLPEHHILMESYHGLNDWFPEISTYESIKFYQMGFYEAMADLSELNISIDYDMEHWTPDYNKDLNNSILTEERLAQYDVIFLQSPMLPYSPLEISNLKNYFENGGNIFFLGTRYQDLVVENINYLFSELGVNIQINEENIMADNWQGFYTSVSPQTISEFNNAELFSGVNNIYWNYGNSFTVTSNAESIATINEKTVVALYNGTSQKKGSVLAFGDLHWLYYDYQSTSYAQDHFNLLNNIVEFFLPEEDVSINVNLERDRISNPKIDISLYLKNQTSESPITSSDYTSLTLNISNNGVSELIVLNTTYSDNGIYFNNTYDLLNPSYSPYTIEINLTIGLKEYHKITKILYFDKTEVPKIIALYSYNEYITRSIGDSTNLIAVMDDPNYGLIEGYLSIYSYSLYNSKASVNKTLTFTHQESDLYSHIFDPDVTDPSGFAIFYIIPTNSNYITPNSPRYAFEIINNPPEILKESSKFNFGAYGDIYFDDTESDEASYVYPSQQGDTFNFVVDVGDTAYYEDNNSNMRVFVNLFICSVTDDNYVILIFPETLKVSELNYQLSSDKYEGTFTIPNTMRYNSISGTKLRSTASGFDTDTNEGYLGLLFVTVYDSEGGTDDFIIILIISERPIDPTLIIIIVISIIALLGVVGGMIYFARRKKHPRTKVQPKIQEYYYQPEESEEQRYITPEPVSQIGASFYCPFCGEFIGTPRKFCPHCGESLLFFQQDE